jgi:hypothetical protein
MMMCSSPQRCLSYAKDTEARMENVVSIRAIADESLRLLPNDHSPPSNMAASSLPQVYLAGATGLTGTSCASPLF